MLGAFPDAEPTPLTARGAFDLPPDRRVDDHPAFVDGLVEVQDEGSQLIALACEPADGERIARPLRRSGRQGAGARRGRSGRDDPRHRQQSRAPVQAGAARRAGGRDDRDAAAQPAQRAGGARRLARRGRPRAGRRAMLGQRHVAAQSGGPLAADARAARPARRGPAAAARHRRRAGAPGRAAGLRRLLAPVPRRGRADRRTSSPPFIVD